MVSLDSLYALSKYDQERMCLLLGRMNGISVVALRLASVFGTHQRLGNRHAGVLSTFALRLLHGHPPLVFEDGLQQRDFVSVRDVARALRLALESNTVSGMVLNIGSGERQSILDVARKTAAALGRDHAVPELTGTYRLGDARHALVDISLARRFLGYEPRVTLDGGLTELAQWLDGQPHRRTAEAAREAWL